MTTTKKKTGKLKTSKEIHDLIDRFKKDLCKIDPQFKKCFEPAHYKSSDGRETIDGIRIILDPTRQLGYYHGLQLKYIGRSGSVKKDTTVENEAKNLYYTMESLKIVYEYF